MKSKKRITIIFAAAMILALCLTLLVSCTDKHQHVWKEIAGSNTATCTEDGVILSKCEGCGLTKQTPSVALGHDWDEDDVDVIEPATCKKMGRGSAHCKREDCNATQEIELDIVPHNIVKPDFDKNKAATCLTAGLRAGKCGMCEEYVEIELAPLGHDFTGESKTTAEASCEEEGVREISCRRKNCDGDDNGNKPAKQIITSPAIGHDWQDGATLDKEPTLTSTGSRSIHCNRCDKTKDEETLPMLVAGQKTTYKFRVARANRETLKVGVSGVKITIKDSEGQIVQTSNNQNFNQVTATMTVDLLPANYTVEVTGLPNGYYSKGSYEVRPGSVEMDLTVNASLLPAEQATSDTKYGLGSVLHDYTFRDLNSSGRKVKLSELLAEKKIVLLNFFFVTCGACQSEMPGLVSAYNLYKEDMAVVMLDVVNYDDEDGIVNDFLRPFNVPAEWYAVQDMTPSGADSSQYNNICEKFGLNSAPQNLIIDQEGVVVYYKGGSTGEMEFRNIFKKYTSAPYTNTPAPSAPAAPTSENEARAFACSDVVIPKKDDRY